MNLFQGETITKFKFACFQSSHKLLMLLRQTSAKSTQLPTVVSPTAVASSRQFHNQALTGAQAIVPEIRRQHATNCTSQWLLMLRYWWKFY